MVDWNDVTEAVESIQLQLGEGRDLVGREDEVSTVLAALQESQAALAVMGAILQVGHLSNCALWSLPCRCGLADDAKAALALPAFKAALS